MKRANNMLVQAHKWPLRLPPQSKSIALEENFAAPFTWEIIQRVSPKLRVVLDIGCGSGQLLAQLVAQERELWGIDKDDGKVRRAYHKTVGAAGRVRLMTANVLGHQLPYNYFHAVVSSFALHDMPYNEVVQLITKLLTDVGEVILVDIEHGYTPFVRERITEAWRAVNDYGVGAMPYWQSGEQTVNEWLANCVRLYGTTEMKAHINKPHAPLESKEEVMKCWATQHDVLESRDLWPGIYLLHCRKKPSTPQREL